VSRCRALGDLGVGGRHATYFITSQSQANRYRKTILSPPGHLACPRPARRAVACPDRGREDHVSRAFAEFADTASPTSTSGPLAPNRDPLRPVNRPFVEVKGLEPSASTLRMYGSRSFDQALFLGPSCKRRFDPLRFPHNPSPFLSIKTRKDTPERSRSVATSRYPGSIGTRSQRAALVPPGRRSRSSASSGTSPTLKPQLLVAG
jgi:hypothetical protein